MMEVQECPFCGHKVCQINGGPGDYYAICCDCAANGPSKETKEEATRSWNRVATAVRVCW